MVYELTGECRVCVWRLHRLQSAVCAWHFLLRRFHQHSNQQCYLCTCTTVFELVWDTDVISSSVGFQTTQLALWLDARAFSSECRMFMYFRLWLKTVVTLPRAAQPPSLYECVPARLEAHYSPAQLRPSSCLWALALELWWLFCFVSSCWLVSLSFTYHLHSSVTTTSDWKNHQNAVNKTKTSTSYYTDDNFQLEQVML